ncbi:hypothetical protein CIB93_36660 [Streptomyces sp. WZ.A104]|uniref:Integral membrane protein n=1 Tax=Streptomyces durocortorensis TaxID=2811104 RepID=A0ABY9VWY5_9ACTN|nr:MULTISPECIES: hypothetical protein [Streptomyces]PCG81203.1 hypothetical protein CIB93_36660 [Streptomyces sp. WZ.A104]WNF27704.1 hypothetical protein RI138_13195 [Streptomyces durocortorensis]
MSENSEAPGTPPAGGKPSGGAPTPPGPQPEPIRFFGTTWVEHDGGYGLRRAGVAAGSLAAAVAACFVLRFAFQGLEIAEVGNLVGMLVIVMFAICSAIAFRKTWEGFRARPKDPAREDALRGLKSIGFIGSLLAYFVRSLVEAPGEKLRRTEYETARTQYEKRRSARTGNPAARKSSGRKRPKRT